MYLSYLLEVLLDLLELSDVLELLDCASIRLTTSEIRLKLEPLSMITCAGRVVDGRPSILSLVLTPAAAHPQTFALLLIVLLVWQLV